VTEVRRRTSARDLLRDPGRHLEPRHVTVAATTASVLAVAAGVVVLVFALLGVGEPSGLPRSVLLGTPIALFGIAAYLRLSPPAPRSIVWVSVPLAGIAAIVILDVLSQDASAGAQVFLCFPVLYSASQLRAVAAGAVAAAAVAAEMYISFSLQPIGAAIIDVVYVSATLIAMTVLLVRAGIRQDLLVAKLRELATIDPLTGLVTRRVFDDVARSALAQRRQGDGTALLVIDVDGFKHINDTHGHPVGDDALVHLANVLTVAIRPDAVVSRIGGDELAILLPDCSYAAARTRAEQLVVAVRRHPLHLGDGERVDVSVSIGVAQAPQHAADLRTLYAVADAALYRAKRDGRDRVGRSVPVA
jgi:diguanylate cyclase (GGDEF)-like protein